MVHVTSTIVSIATLTRVERVMVIVTQELALQERPVELIIFLNIIHFCRLVFHPVQKFVFLPVAENRVPLHLKIRSEQQFRQRRQRQHSSQLINQVDVIATENRVPLHLKIRSE